MVLGGVVGGIGVDHERGEHDLLGAVPELVDGERALGGGVHHHDVDAALQPEETVQR